MEILEEQDYLYIYFKIGYNEKDAFKKECRGIWSPNVKQWYIKLDICDMEYSNMKYEEIADYIKETIGHRIYMFKYNYSHSSFDKDIGSYSQAEGNVIKIVDELFRTYKLVALKQIEMNRLQNDDYCDF